MAPADHERFARKSLWAKLVAACVTLALAVGVFAHLYVDSGSKDEDCELDEVDDADIGGSFRAMVLAQFEQCECVDVERVRAMFMSPTSVIVVACFAYSFFLSIIHINGVRKHIVSLGIADKVKSAVYSRKSSCLPSGTTGDRTSSGAEGTNMARAGDEETSGDRSSSGAEGTNMARAGDEETSATGRAAVLR